MLFLFDVLTLRFFEVGNEYGIYYFHLEKVRYGGTL